MADRICTRYRDNDGLDLGCHLMSKEYLLEAYPEFVPWMKAPGLWSWGNNVCGQLADNTVTSRSSPVQTISNGTNWKQSSLGFIHSAAIKTDGTLWLWGNNGNYVGELGIGGANWGIKSSPVQTASGGANWRQVSLGKSITVSHSAAIKTDGSLWLWGSGSAGEIGNNNSAVNMLTPVQTISGGNNWRQVSLGCRFSTAIKTDGTLWTWGCNSYGRLGDNSLTSRSSPVQTISGGNNWKQVAAGYIHTGAIKDDGTLWLWGSTYGGMLGNNTLLVGGNYAHRSSPVQTISGGTNWKQVSLGNRHTAAIKTDGTLWIWGLGDYGRLGTNSFVAVSSPVQTISGGTNWRQVSASFFHTSSIKTDGTLWMWGRNNCGQLGINNITDRSSPVQTITGGTGWRQVSAGCTQTATIRDEDEY